MKEVNKWNNSQGLKEAGVQCILCHAYTDALECTFVFM